MSPDLSEYARDRYITKDSGKRVEFASGMRRDTDEGKPRYDLIPILPLRRLADLYARGAEKYGDSNWQNANSHEELQRFKASMLRHVYQALNGDTDEDHWAAVAWNCFAVMWLTDKLGDERDPELERLLAEEQEIEEWIQAQKALDELPPCSACGGRGLTPAHGTCRTCHGAGVTYGNFSLEKSDDQDTSKPFMDALLAAGEEAIELECQIRKLAREGGHEQSVTRFEINEGRFNEWAQAQREVAE